MFTLKQRKAWILSQIYTCDYSDATGEIDTTDKLSDAEKVQYIADRLKSEAVYPYNIARHKGNMQDLIADHLQGLPSWLTVPYSNHEILKLAIEWGYDVSTEKKEDRFLANYWNACAMGVISLLKQYGVKL